MDKNTPARFLDTAYDAYKSNPSATNQILQAAAQGAPVGLRGLAAAAAQQSQQQAQQAMAALQQQGPQPNVIQKLATQGIMSQMDTGLPIAQPLPEEAPQMMATGGLVAFADGGSVLPPDVIEAIQSHFAEGGAVHGYAEGETVLGDIASQYGRFAPLPGAEEDTGLLPRLIREIRGARVGRGGISAEDLMRDTEEAFTPEVIATRGRGASAPVSGISTLGLEDYEPTGLYKPELSLTEKPKATPKPESIPEAKKVTPEFKKASIDTSSTATGTPAKASSLTAGESMGIPTGAGGLEGLRDMMMELRGRKTMTPAVSKELEDLRNSARTSTILQSLLGGLGAGLSSPYGGRFALGKAALGSLAGYQKGIGSEEEIGRKAFDVLRGYEDAPAEEQAKAVDLVMGQLGKSAELQAQRDIADLKGEGALERLLYSEYGKNLRYGQGKPVDEAKLAQIQNLAEDNARKTIDAENKKRAEAIPAKLPLSAEEEMDIRRREFIRQQQFIQSGGTNLGLGANIAAGQAGGLGGRPPIID